MQAVAGGFTSRFFYSQAGQSLFTQEGKTSQFHNQVYFSGSLVARRSVPVGGGAALVTYQHTDALGSPVAETDATGALVRRERLTAYGEPADGIWADGPGFTGHQMDAASGLVYMQQRYYDPALGRFLSVDPVAADMENGRNFNRFNYANNNPYTFTDPDGRVAVCLVPPVLPVCVAIAEIVVDGLIIAGAAILIAAPVIMQQNESGEGETAGEGSSERDVVIGDKVRGQLGDRGWTEEGVREAAAGEPSGTTVDNTGGKVGSAGEPASVYGSPESGYIVVNDGTREVIQVAPGAETDPSWKPDPRIDWTKE